LGHPIVGDFLMQSTCLAVPILAGKTDSVRAMFKTIKEEKMKDYLRVQKNAGVKKEEDFLQVTPMGDMLLLYIESKDIQKTFMTFAASKDPFDLWFIEEMKKNTGVDFSQPMPGPLPEMLMSYHKPMI
jgi:hypothetical protein